MMRLPVFWMSWVIVILMSCHTDTPQSTSEVQSPVVITEEMLFGLPKDSFEIHKGTIKPNEFLSSILTKYDVSPQQIHVLANNSEQTFSVRALRSGKRYTVFRKDSVSPASWFIYEPNDRTYVKYDLDNADVSIHTRHIDTTVTTFAGVIKGSLWATLKEQGLPISLITKMEDAFEWTISFYHIKEKDRFKLIYEELCVDGAPGGIGRLLGAYFYTGSTPYYAVWYDSERYRGYFDLEGRPMKKAFLRDPVRSSRISSRYSMRRFHPKLKYYRPHYGTDYAAPMNTPIRAVADGVVTHATYKGGNGNYVKIRHDKVYQTQYLHMNKFARGIKPGVRVRQGQTIGYVGQTGLATGPHVCFRFWKNGRQVDHLRENLPPPEPMSKDELPLYYNERDVIVQILDGIQLVQNTNEVSQEDAGVISLLQE